mgnify:FL=1
MQKVRLGDIAILINGDRGKNYPSQADITNDGEVPFVNAGHLNGREIAFDEMNYISKDKYEKLSSGKFQEGDILYCLRGSIGKKAIVSTDIKGAIASSLVIIRPNSEKLYGEYLMLALESPAIKEQLTKANNGSSQPNLSAASVREYEIELPELLIQREVVEKLVKVRDIIDNRRQELQLLDDLIKARFVELFGLHYKNHINEKQLDEVCNFIDYRGKTPEKSEYGIPLITAKNVKDNRFSIEPQEFIPEENYDDVMTRGIPKANDVLFTTEAPLGNVCRIPAVYQKFCVGQRLITMQPHEEVLNSEYLEHALASAEFQEKMWQKASGSTVKGIRSKLLVLLTIPVPQIELQKQFADFVKQVDKSKVKVQKSLDETQCLFDSLMQKYFG